MKEKIITFETAKLAKEKGFNEICEYGYFDRDDEIILDISDHNNSDNLDISAPTQALLQKWLREVHNINVYCQPVDYENTDKWFNNIASHNPPFTGTYEEALEVGLQEALTLIQFQNGQQ
jgi:hypothetical protein